MRSQEIIHRTAQFMGGKRQSSKTLRRANESKQLEATLITQAVIQASRLLTSGLLFGPVGRDPQGGLGKHGLMTQVMMEAFHGPKSTMVISHCQDQRSVEGAEVCIQWTAEN